MSRLVETLDKIISTLTEETEDQEKRARNLNSSRLRAAKQKARSKFVWDRRDLAVPQTPRENHYSSKEEFDRELENYHDLHNKFFNDHHEWERNLTKGMGERKASDELHRRIMNPTPEEQSEDQAFRDKYSAIKKQRDLEFAEREAKANRIKREEDRQKSQTKKLADKAHYDALSPREKRKADYAKEFESDPVKAASTPYRQAKDYDPNINSGYWGGTMATVRAPRSKGHGPDRDDS